MAKKAAKGAAKKKRAHVHARVAFGNVFSKGNEKAQSFFA